MNLELNQRTQALRKLLAMIREEYISSGSNINPTPYDTAVNQLASTKVEEKGIKQAMKLFDLLSRIERAQYDFKANHNYSKTVMDLTNQRHQYFKRNEAGDFEMVTNQ